MPRLPKLFQGDIVLVPFPLTDLTGRKVRPAIIVSANPQGLELIVAFITSVMTNRSPRGAEVELLKSDPEFGMSGLKADSLVRLDKLVTISSSVIKRRLGVSGSAMQAKIAVNLRRAFDLK